MKKLSSIQISFAVAAIVIMASSYAMATVGWKVDTDEPVYARVRFNGATSIPSGVATKVMMNQEIASAGVYIDTADGSISVEESGEYNMSVFTSFASNATGYREYRVYVGGANTAQFNTNAVNGRPTKLTGTLEIDLTSTQKIEVYLIHNAGGPLDASFTTFNLYKR